MLIADINVTADSTRVSKYRTVASSHAMSCHCRCTSTNSTKKDTNTHTHDKMLFWSFPHSKQGMNSVRQQTLEHSGRYAECPEIHSQSSETLYLEHGA
jgi:hypothetical protein